MQEASFSVRFVPGMRSPSLISPRAARLKPQKCGPDKERMLQAAGLGAPGGGQGAPHLRHRDPRRGELKHTHRRGQLPTRPCAKRRFSCMSSYSSGYIIASSSEPPIPTHTHAYPHTHRDAYATP
eukprot:1434751-Rhodomonas_salina.2